MSLLVTEVITAVLCLALGCSYREFAEQVASPSTLDDEPGNAEAGPEV
jgi:hypothetical protein